eukprot:COSAG01_NODE_38545_length_488_cov_0.976864_2_plen_87_part_00
MRCALSAARVPSGHTGATHTRPATHSAAAARATVSDSSRRGGGTTQEHSEALMAQLVEAQAQLAAQTQRCEHLAAQRVRAICRDLR